MVEGLTPKRSRPGAQETPNTADAFLALCKKSFNRKFSFDFPELQEGALRLVEPL